MKVYLAGVLVRGRRVFVQKGPSRDRCDLCNRQPDNVGSGAHVDYRPAIDKPLGYALADILFTRGAGAIDGEFARELEYGAPSTIPQPYLIEKLQQLAATDSSAVRAAACGLLAHYRPEMRNSK